MKKSLFRELLWIIPIAGVSLYLSYRVNLFTKGLSEINLHDTYFVFGSDNTTTLSYFLEAFSLLAFLIYGIKEAFTKYTSLLANSIIIIAGAGVIITQVSFYLVSWLMYSNIKTASTESEGWTIYPPLSASNEVYMSGESPNSVETIYNIFQYGFLFVVISLIIFVSIRTGILLAAKRKADATNPGF